MSCGQPYNHGHAKSHLILEAKQGLAWLSTWMADRLDITGAVSFWPSIQGVYLSSAQDSGIDCSIPATLYRKSDL